MACIIARYNSLLQWCRNHSLGLGIHGQGFYTADPDLRVVVGNTGICSEHQGFHATDPELSGMLLCP